MKRFTLAIAAMLMVAASANAAAYVASTHSATTDLAGHQTWILNLEADNPVVGISAVFTGAMNQTLAYNSLITVFANEGLIDSNVSYVDHHDSHFLFNGPGPGDLPALDKLDDATHLGAAVTAGEGSDLGLGSMFDLAQIVAPDGGMVAYSIEINDGTGALTTIAGDDLKDLIIPEPAALALMSIALVGLGFFRRSK